MSPTQMDEMLKFYNPSNFDLSIYLNKFLPNLITDNFVSSSNPLKQMELTLTNLGIKIKKSGFAVTHQYVITECGFYVSSGGYVSRYTFQSLKNPDFEHEVTELEQTVFTLPVQCHDPVNFCDTTNQ